MMSDAITAANIITDAMAANQFAALLSNARARRDYEGEIAHLRAWLQWYEQQNQTLLQRLQPIFNEIQARDDARERHVAQLEQEIQDLRRENANLAAGKKAAEDLAQARGMRLADWTLFGKDLSAERV